MIKGTTSSGFAFSIPETITDDWEIVEAYCKIMRGDILEVDKFPLMILGTEANVKKLKNHIKKNVGHVSASALMKELREIMNANDLTKNL